MSTETGLVLRMCSSVPAPPGPSRQNSLPQTAQQGIILAILYPSVVTPPLSQHHRMMTTEKIPGQHTCSPVPVPPGQQQQKLLASDGQAGDTFGWWSVSLNGDSVLVSSCRDDDNGLDSGSAYVFTKVSENQPPETPTAPTGPSSGQKGVEYLFSAVTTDPDGDNISYFFDWGDGTNSGWVRTYNRALPGSGFDAWG